MSNSNPHSYMHNDKFNKYFRRTSLHLFILNIILLIAGRYLIYYLACEFTAHHACKNAEINLKSTTTNRFNLWIINSLMESWGVHLTWLDCKLIVFLCKLYCMLNLSGIDKINRRIRYKTNSGSCSQIRGMKYSWTSLKLPPWWQKNVPVVERS